MKYESINFPEPEQTSAEVDEKILTFESINDKINTTDVAVNESLDNTRPEAEAEFFADPTLIHPRNEYGRLDAAKVSRNLQTLAQARQEIDEANISDKQKRFLQLILDYDYRKNDFLAANIAYNEAQTPEDKALAAEYHRAANEALYKKPDEGVFYSILSEQLDKIDVNNLRPEDQANYQRLLEAIGPIKEADAKRFQPKPETLTRFSELANEFYGDIFAKIPTDRESFSPQEAADIVNNILQEDFEGTDYHALVAPNKKLASVDQVTREIVFPGARVDGNYNLTDLKKILVHEFGTHALRAIPYEQQPIVAFSRELPNNETWDEGVAKSMEYAVSGELQKPGEVHYINIGLATFKDKNFREILDIHSMLKFLADATPEETDEERTQRMQKIRKQLFPRVQRCFRGTGELPNFKDLVYYNGSEMVWKYIEEHIDDPELFTNLFLSGRTVATDKDQERLVYEMHVDGLGEQIS